MLLIYALVLFGLVLVSLIVCGYYSSRLNQVSIVHNFPVSAQQLWTIIRHVDQTSHRRRGEKAIEVLREQNGKIIEWMVHTTQGGFRVYRIEERSSQHFSKILVASTFGVTGKWDYFIQEKNGFTTLTIEENYIIPSCLYRIYLLIRGKKLHLNKEIRRIESYLTKTKQSDNFNTLRAV